MNKIGFDNKKYLSLQSEKIEERIQSFGDKLYLEFGGKLFDDYHASRVLPGFEPDSKIKMLLKLKDVAEILVVISANDIIKNKYRSDLGITYDADVLRLIVRMSIMPYVNLVGSTNKDGLLLLERFSPLLALIPGLVYGWGYTQGVAVRSQVHTDIAAGKRKQKRKEKKARQQRQAQRKGPEQLN